MSQRHRFEVRRDALGFPIGKGTRFSLMIAGCLAASIAGWLVLSLASNPAFDWAAVGQYLFHPQVLRGLWTTIWLTGYR